MKLARSLAAGMALALLTGVAACSPSVDLSAEPIPEASAIASVPPAPPAVPAVEGLPDYAYRSAAAVRGYQIAVAEKELISVLPCYCGCGEDDQYKNLLNCFMDDAGEYNPHGANCQVCLDEAEDALLWKTEGLSTREIRSRIDEAYEGRGNPTDTPPVLE